MKNVLLVYKKSTYKHLFLDKNISPEFLNINPQIIRRFKRTHAQHYVVLEKIESILKERGVKYSKVSRGRRGDLSGYDLIITVGGDGTFLEGARDIRRQLILGVNSDPKWSVGKFCAATSKTFPEILDRVLKKQARIRVYSRMRLKIKRISEKINVLNDVLICHKNPAAMSRYCINVKGVKEEQRSSGIWVATAAGSTGAIHSAGGKIQPLTSKKLQYHVRELYCGRGATHRFKSGFFSPPQTIKVTSLMKDGILYVDGSHIHYPFSFGTDVVISHSPQPLRVIQ